MTDREGAAVTAIEKPWTAGERDAFEQWYCDDAAATVKIKMLPIEILALRDGDTYGAKRVALNSKWEAWQARAALSRANPALSAGEKG